MITSPFENAASLMARVLGAEDYRFVLTPHPISSATSGQLEARAREAVAESLEILVG